MQFFSKKIFCASQSVLEKQKTTSFVLLQPPFPCKKTTFQILFPSFVYISIHISQSNLSQSFQKPKKKKIISTLSNICLALSEKTIIKASIHSLIPYCSSCFCLLTVAFSYYL